MLSGPVPIKLVPHCILPSDIMEGLPGGNILDDFARLKPAGHNQSPLNHAPRSKETINAVRQSADLAILLVNSYPGTNDCGNSYFNEVTPLL